MTLFLALSCCEGVVTTYPITKLALWVTFGIAALVLAVGVALGLLIAKKRARTVKD